MKKPPHPCHEIKANLMAMHAATVKLGRESADIGFCHDLWKIMVKACDESERQLFNGSGGKAAFAALCFVRKLKRKCRRLAMLHKP